MSESREDSIYFARLSEQGERYEDMIKYMQIVAKVSLRILSINFVLQFPNELSNDERNLLSVAYKNSVKTRRDAWRTIQAIQNKEELKVSSRLSHNLFPILQGNKFLPLISMYKEKIEGELKDICQDVLNLLD